MTTAQLLRQRVGRMLDDAELTAYSQELFLDGLSAALDAILPWVPKTAVKVIEGDGNDTFELPDDCYMVESVMNDQGQLLRKGILIPGNYRGDFSEGNDWLEYPYGSISFNETVSSGEVYTIYYLAHWTKPTPQTLNKKLEPPAYTHLALALYTTAYMILPSAVSAAEVRQWATRVDSGNPEHNPMQLAAKYLLRLFTEEMNRHPSHQKAQK